MPRKKSDERKDIMPDKKEMKKTAIQATPYIAGGTLGAFIGAGVGLAATALVENEQTRGKLLELFDTVRHRVERMPSARRMLGDGQQDGYGMKMGQAKGARATEEKTKSGERKSG